jgi:hypothetical protein
VKTGIGFLYQVIRHEFMAPEPASTVLNRDYCFHNDLPTGAWLDAPEIMAAGSHLNYRGGPTPSIAFRT